MLSGLEKSIVVPRQTGDATAAFTAEGSAVAESSLTFDSLTMTPKRISAKSSYTLETFMQSDPSIDQLIQFGMQIKNFFGDISRKADYMLLLLFYNSPVLDRLLLKFL